MFIFRLVYITHYYFSHSLITNKHKRPLNFISVNDLHVYTQSLNLHFFSTTFESPVRRPLTNSVQSLYIASCKQTYYSCCEHIESRGPRIASNANVLFI